MNFRTLTTSTIALLLAATISVAQDKPASNVQTVQAVKPQQAKDNRTFPIPGRTEPFESTTIFTRATGIVSERTRDIGDLVKKGDLLAEISAPEVDKAVDSAKANVDQAVARAKNARALANRAKSLINDRAIAQEELEQRQANADELDAAVRLAEAELARLQEEQRFSKVYAPFDGVIAGRNFNRGDRVRGDSATAEGWLYRLVQVEQLRFVVAAPPELAMQLKKGDKGTVRFTELPGASFDAEFYRSSAVFDTASGTMRVELLLPNKDLKVPAGLTGTATFTLAPSQERFLVPTNALLLSRGNARMVTVVDGKAKFINVAVGRTLGSNIEVISSEIKPDSQVVLNPNAMLREGDALQVAAPQAQAGK